MLDSWIAWTLLAAVMQSVRTATQKQLTSHMSAEAATLVRYLFGIPFVLTYFGIVLWQADESLPQMGATFLTCVVLAGILQIVATVLLIRLFTLRNFAVGSTFVRTEIVITALIGAAFFGDQIAGLGWLAVLICSAGLIAMSRTDGAAFGGLLNRSAIYGLGAGVAFSLTSLFIRTGSLSLGLESAILAAAMTLTLMVLLQTLLSGVMVAWLKPADLAVVVRQWRPGLFVGLTSVLGSAGWFTAFTLERAAYVKTLGQVEFLITLGISVWLFGERPTRRELTGMLLIVLGVVVLLRSP